MVQIRTFCPAAVPPDSEERAITAFLFQHLGTFGDPHGDIQKAIDYALGRNGTPGGAILCATGAAGILGAVVLNRTGMSRYIPENILVYIATHCEHRGKGLGRQLMAAAIESVEGSIALHVETDNPARRLYESLGFTNKYLEMRLHR